MQPDKILNFFNELVVKHFLVHFIPGVFLYYGISNFISLGLNSEILYPIWIGAIAWLSGFLLEYTRFTEESKHIQHLQKEGVKAHVFLILSKTGLSLIFLCFFNLLGLGLNYVEFAPENLNYLLEQMIKLLLIFNLGRYLHRKFRREIKALG